MNGPRLHHYQYAHVRLPELVFSFKDSILGLLEIKGTGYLKGIWYRLGSTLGHEERLVADGLELMLFEDKQFCGSVITLPETKYQTEAYMVALVGESVSGSVLTDGQRDFRCKDLRYFTLERGVEKGEACLGEWIDGRHANYGPSPVVDAKAFWTACIRHMGIETV